MRLVLFAIGYPFGTGEFFLENELRAAESNFDEIVIATYKKQMKTPTLYVPANAKVVALRQQETALRDALCFARAAFRPGCWKEAVHGCRERGWKQLATVVKQILLAQRQMYYIRRSEQQWLGDAAQRKQTVCYSYWLDPTPLWLATRYPQQFRALICRAHGGDCFFDRGYVPWRAQTLAALDAVFPISEMGKQDLLAHYGDQVPALAEKLHVARLGVELPDRTGPVPGASEPAVLVSCSNVIGLKRLDLLIDALAQYDGKPLRWVHFGDGPLLGEMTERAARLLKDQKNVTWEFRGRVANAEILRFYAEQPVTLFVNCSDAEGIPVSAMEAMAYGIPVIAREVGGLAELVNDACGALLPQHIEAGALTEAIRRLVAEEAGLHLRRRAQARARIESAYWTQKNYQAFWEQVKGTERA